MNKEPLFLDSEPEFEPEDNPRVFKNEQKDFAGTTYLYTFSSQKQPRPQAELLEYLKNNRDQEFYLPISYEGKNNRYFGYYDSAESFVYNLTKTKSKDRHFYEILSKEVKFYADLDWKWDETQEYNDEAEAKIIVEFITLFSKCYNKIVDGPDFNINNLFILSASDKIKGSLHFIYYDGLYFKNTTRQKEFWDYVKCIQQEEGVLVNMIDHAIYTSNRNFRTPWSSKYDSKRILKPRDAQGKVIKFGKKKEILNYLINLSKPGGREVKLNIPSEYKLQQIIKQNRNIIRQIKSPDEIEQIILDKIPNVEIYSRKGNMITLKTIDCRKCLISGEDNFSDCSYIVIRDDGLYYHCHDEGCEGKSLKIYEFELKKVKAINWNWFFDYAKLGASVDIANFKSEIVKYMNTYYVLITAQSKCIVIKKVYKNIEVEGKCYTCPENKYMTKGSLQDELANVQTIITTTRGEKHHIKVFDVWFHARNRNQKDDVNFNPKVELSQKFGNSITYNLWNGYMIKPEHLKDVKPLTRDDAFLQHIWKRWAYQNETVYKFICQWFATHLQQPWKKLRSNLVIRGREGAGKGCIISPLRKIMGESMFFHPTSANSVLGDFNSSLEGKKLIFLDELFWGGDKNKAGILKKLSTEDTININRKHMPDYSIDNFVNIIICSNEDWVIPAGEQARRYCVIDIDNEFAGLDDTPQELLDITSTEIHRIAKTFYEWDIADFDDRRPPKTDALREQKVLSFDPTTRFVYDLLAQGYFETRSETWEFGSDFIPKSVIYEQFGRTTGNSRHTSKIAFWKKFSNICNIDIQKKRVLVEGATKNLHCIKTKDIQTMRNEFRTYIKDPNWSFPELPRSVPRDENEEDLGEARYVEEEKEEDDFAE